MPKHQFFYGVCKPMCFTTQVGKWKRAASLTTQFLPVKRLPPPILTMLLFRRFWVCALVLGPQFLRHKTLPAPILRGSGFVCFSGVHPWHQHAGTFTTVWEPFECLHSFAFTVFAYYRPVVYIASVPDNSFQMRVEWLWRPTLS